MIDHCILPLNIIYHHNDFFSANRRDEIKPLLDALQISITHQLASSKLHLNDSLDELKLCRDGNLFLKVSQKYHKNAFKFSIAVI